MPYPLSPEHVASPWCLARLQHVAVAVVDGDDVQVTCVVEASPLDSDETQYMSGTWFTPSAPLAAAETRKERMAPSAWTAVPPERLPSHSLFHWQYHMWGTLELPGTDHLVQPQDLFGQVAGSPASASVGHPQHHEEQHSQDDR